MQYVRYDLHTSSAPSSGWLGSIARSALKALLPAANPDFEDHYENVLFWWLELDESNVPRREIGFDVSGHPIVAAPFGRNYGVFTDSNAPCVGFDPIPKNDFNAQWATFTETWNGHHAK